MAKKDYLAIDIGASNGRTIVGEFDGNIVSLKEVYRFLNEPVAILDNFYWDILRIFKEIKNGLLKYSADNCNDLVSVGLDTWGCDFGLLDSQGNLLSNPNHYRNKRIDKIMEETSKLILPREMFNLTGNAPIKYNTVYQFLSMCSDQKIFYDNAKTMLLMPDLFAYFLTGEKVMEFTNATTTQMMNIKRDSWCRPLLERLNISERIFPPIVSAGSAIGKVTKEIGEYTGIGSASFIATATHDTAAAVAAVPMLQNAAFISSGTWSLIGVEVREPYTSDEIYSCDFSNEGGVENYNLLLRNTVGMWIIQECKREWDKYGENIGYNELLREAEMAGGFQSFIDPDHELFSMPGNMPSKIREYCLNTNQNVPDSRGRIARCIFESMALKYRWCIDKLEGILQKSLTSIHIVGGGCQNHMLNQFTANSTGKLVIAGPVEATAIGNIMVQVMANKEISNLGEIRQVVKNSFCCQRYEPKNFSEWDEAYGRFIKIIESKK